MIITSTMNIITSLELKLSTVISVHGECSSNKEKRRIWEITKTIVEIVSDPCSCARWIQFPSIYECSKKLAYTWAVVSSSFISGCQLCQLACRFWYKNQMENIKFTLALMSLCLVKQAFLTVKALRKDTMLDPNMGWHQQYGKKPTAFVIPAERIGTWMFTI